jgi:hypothetical protein
LAKVILPREVRTEANENARENVVERYRFQHQPILLLLVTKHVGKLKPESKLAEHLYLQFPINGRAAPAWKADADEAQM